MCAVIDHIRAARVSAVRRGEHAEVMRRLQEERAHLDKCATCAMNIQPLYLQLWTNAKIGVDVYDLVS